MTSINSGGRIPDDAPECLQEQVAAATKRFKLELASLAGGLLEIPAVQSLLGYSSRAAVYRAVAGRRLLAVKDGGRLGFPQCQFEEGQVFDGIMAILKAAPTVNGWRILQFLYSQEDGLAGDRPIELVRGSQSDVARAVRFARRLEQ